MRRRAGGPSRMFAYRPRPIRRGNKQVAQYRRETALRGGLIMAKSGRLKLGDNILRTL